MTALTNDSHLRIYEPPPIRWHMLVGCIRLEARDESVPCWAHRKLQAAFLGVRWEYVGCRQAPKGWRCSRSAGHGGPCAAHPQGWRKLFWMVRLSDWRRISWWDVVGMMALLFMLSSVLAK